MKPERSVIFYLTPVSGSGYLHHRKIAIHKPQKPCLRRRGVSLAHMASSTNTWLPRPTHRLRSGWIDRRYTRKPSQDGSLCSPFGRSSPSHCRLHNVQAGCVGLVPTRSSRRAILSSTNQTVTPACFRVTRELVLLPLCMEWPYWYVHCLTGARDVSWKGARAPAITK